MSQVMYLSTAGRVWGQTAAAVYTLQAGIGWPQVRFLFKFCRVVLRACWSDSQCLKSEHIQLDVS